MRVGDWRRKAASERYIVQSVTTVGKKSEIPPGPWGVCLEHKSFILSGGQENWDVYPPTPMSHAHDHLVFPAYLPQAGCAVIRKCKQKDRLKKAVLSLQRRHLRALGRYRVWLPQLLRMTSSSSMADWWRVPLQGSGSNGQRTVEQECRRQNPEQKQACPWLTLRQIAQPCRDLRPLGFRVISCLKLKTRTLAETKTKRWTNKKMSLAHGISSEN